MATDSKMHCFSSGQTKNKKKYWAAFGVRTAATIEGIEFETFDEVGFAVTANPKVQDLVGKDVDRSALEALGVTFKKKGA